MGRRVLGLASQTAEKTLFWSRKGKLQGFTPSHAGLWVSILSSAKPHGKVNVQPQGRDQEPLGKDSNISISRQVCCWDRWHCQKLCLQVQSKPRGRELEGCSADNSFQSALAWKGFRSSLPCLPRSLCPHTPYARESCPPTVKAHKEGCWGPSHVYSWAIRALGVWVPHNWAPTLPAGTPGRLVLPNVLL